MGFFRKIGSFFGKKEHPKKWGDFFQNGDDINCFMDNIVDKFEDRDKPLSPEEIAERAIKIVNGISFISAVMLDDNHPIQKVSFCNDIEKLALLQSHFVNMYVWMTMQYFTLFKSQYLEESVQQVCMMHLKKENEANEWLESLFEASGIKFPNDSITQNLFESMKPGKNFEQYTGYHISQLEKDPEKTPMAKGASIIIDEFYDRNVEHKKEIIFSVGRFGLSTLSKYLRPMLEEHRDIATNQE
jgi:hypothetical protein